MTRKNLLALLILCANSYLCFSDSVFYMDYLHYLRNEENYYFEISPEMIAGTHVNGIGARIIGGYRFNYSFPKDILSFSVGGFLNPYAYANYYGFPGESLQMNSGGLLTFTFGEKLNRTNNPWIITPIGMHNISYYLSYYLSSDGTNQPYGGIEYKFSSNNFILCLRLDNDDAYFFQEDKFRTTKGLVESILYDENHIYGIDLGFILWTGDLLDGITNPQQYLDRNQTYPLTGYGCNYSHGIAFISLIYDFLKIKIGYDSNI